jgi:hypothetical protein
VVEIMAKNKINVCIEKIKPYINIMLYLVSANEDAEVGRWDKVGLRLKDMYECLIDAYQYKSIEEKDIKWIRTILNELGNAIGDIGKWRRIMYEPSIIHLIVHTTFYNFYKCVCGNA